MTDLVFFGSLRSIRLLEIIINKKINPKKLEYAFIKKAKLFRVKNENFPYLIRTKNLIEEVRCLVVRNLDNEDFSKIQFYESVEYKLDKIKLEINKTIKKYNYFKFIKKNITDEEWVYEEWKKKFEETNCKAALLWMKLYDEYKESPGEAEKFWPDMQKQAADKINKK